MRVALVAWPGVGDHGSGKRTGDAPAFQRGFAFAVFGIEQDIIGQEAEIPREQSKYKDMPPQGGNGEGRVPFGMSLAL